MDHSITFLGTVIGNVEKKGKAHCENRIRAAIKPFYGLQSAGIKYPGVDPEVSIKIYESVIPSASVNISTTNLKKIDRYFVYYSDLYKHNISHINKYTEQTKYPALWA